MGKGMKAGKRPKMNQNAQMSQIQAMQSKMMAVQEEIEKMEVEASAGGGAVSVKVNGKHELVSVNISPDVTEDIDMLQDLIIAATNEAMRQVEEMSQNKMQAVTGGMGMGF